MTEQSPEAPIEPTGDLAFEPTGDDVPDGTQLATHEDGELPEEEGDAGVDDDGSEPWYADSEGDA